MWYDPTSDGPQLVAQERLLRYKCTMLGENSWLGRPGGIRTWATTWCMVATGTVLFGIWILAVSSASLCCGFGGCVWLGKPAPREIFRAGHRGAVMQVLEIVLPSFATCKLCDLLSHGRRSAAVWLAPSITESSNQRSGPFNLGIKHSSERRALPIVESSEQRFRSGA